MATIGITAPSVWASYLINGDESGLSVQDLERCDAWIKREGLGLPLTCEPFGFCWHHDAFKEEPHGADCQEYVFMLEEG